MTLPLLLFFVFFIPAGVWVAGLALARAAASAGNPRGARAAVVTSTGAGLLAFTAVLLTVLLTHFRTPDGAAAEEPVQAWVVSLLVLASAAFVGLLVAGLAVWLLAILALKDTPPAPPRDP